MATIIPSSGAISALYMEGYLGGSASTGTNQYLSYKAFTPTGANLSLNQLFNARSPNSIHTYTGQMSWGSLRGKCFGVYTSSSRNNLHSSFYSDSRLGLFLGYFGFGTPTAGTSGVLNTVNQGFPIGIRIDTFTGNPFGISVRAYREGGYWVNLPFTTPTFEIVGNYSALRLDTDPGYIYEMQLYVFPAKNGESRLTPEHGVHSINLVLEEEDRFSSSFGFPLR